MKGSTSYLRVVLPFILIVTLLFILNPVSVLGSNGDQFSDCSGYHVESLQHFYVEPVNIWDSCSYCHSNLLFGTCDIGTVPSDYGFYKTFPPILDAPIVHSKHSGANDRQPQPACGPCHAQVDCTSCHPSVSHEGHAAGTPEAQPKTLNVTNGFFLYDQSFTCAGTKCHDTLQNTGSDKSHVWNIDQLTSLSSLIPVGDNPRGQAVNTSTQKIYVANSASSTVSVIDGNQANPTFNTVIATILVGARPYDITVDELLNTVYVTNPGDGTVSVIEGFSDMVVDTIMTGGTPREIKFDQMNNYVYINDYAGDKVFVLDALAGGQIAYTIPIPTDKVRPTGLAVNIPNNEIYVGYNNPDLYQYSVGIIDPLAGGFIDEISIPGVIGDMTVNEVTNTLYISSGFELTVVDLTFRQVLTTVPLGFDPFGESSLTYDLNQNTIYVITAGSDGTSTLYSIDGATYNFVSMNIVGRYSRDIVSNMSGYLYISSGSSTLVPDPKPTCMSCHTNAQITEHESLHDPNPFMTGSICEACHVDNLSQEHELRNESCDSCHLGNGPNYGATALQVIEDYKNVIDPVYADKAGCQDCHPTATATKGDPSSYANQDHIDLHLPDPTLVDTVCDSCHINNLANDHVNYIDPETGLPYDCFTCHGPDAPQYAQDAILLYVLTQQKAGCPDCHEGVAEDLSTYTGHIDKHQSTEPTPDCLGAGCHTSDNLVYEHEVEELGCLDCHKYAGTKLDPVRVAGAISSHDTNCSSCHDLHGAMEEVHDATNIGTTYRDYLCINCHDTYLIFEHDEKSSSSTSDNGCSTCHPQPRGSFDTWDKSCSQGECHTTAVGPGSVHTQDALKHTSSSDCSDCHNSDVSVVHESIIAGNGSSSCGISGSNGGCHVSTNTVPNTTACETCHPDKAPDHFKADCNLCHKDKTYQKTGLHKTHKKHSDKMLCGGCHEIYDVTPAQMCYICHDDDEDYNPNRPDEIRKVHKKHAKKFDISPDMCQWCHGLDIPTSFNKLDSGPYTPASSCRLCHRDKSYDSGYSYRYSWRDYYRYSWRDYYHNHDGDHQGSSSTRYCKKHADKEIACEACHVDGIPNPRPIYDSCQFCHKYEDDPMQKVHDKHIGDEAWCSACHQSEIPLPRKDCSVCHRKPEDGSKRKIHKEHGGMKFECISCHAF